MSRHALVSITSSVEKESGSLNLVQLHMKLKGNCPPRFSLFQRYHRWGGSDNKHLFLTFLEAGVSKLNAPADSSVWWGSVSWFIKHWLPTCLHKAVKARELSGSPEGKGSEVKLLSRVRLFATPWTAAHQAPPSMGFSRQEYWSGLPFPLMRGQIPLLRVPPSSPTPAPPSHLLIPSPWGLGFQHVNFKRTQTF